MPLYDFECQTCHKIEERICSFSKKDEQVCGCGGPMVAQLSAPTVVSGVHELHTMVPDGFKTVMKGIQSGYARGKDEKAFETKGL